MRRLGQWSGVVLLMVMLTACAAWQETYLTQALNQATQDEVVRTLGPPHLSRDLASGDAVWSYGFTNSVSCTAYILTFDRQKILRDWHWNPC
jgi:hypothetical protein